MTDLHLRGGVVDHLEDEDLELRRLFTRLHAARGGSVAERAEYDDLVVRTLRHVSAREAAVTDVTRAVSAEQGLRRVTARYQHTGPKRRVLIDRLERMSRGPRGAGGARGAELKRGANFDDDLHRLVQLVGNEIEWDLDEALPAIRVVLAGAARGDEL
jgi:hypothetical protein